MNLQPVQRIKNRISTIESRIRSLSGGNFAGDSFGSSLKTVSANSTSRPALSIPTATTTKTTTETSPSPKPDNTATPTLKTRHSQTPIEQNPDLHKWKVLATVMESSEIDESIKAATMTALKSQRTTPPTDPLKETLKTNPEKIVEFDGFTMQAQTAVKFRQLKTLINKRFPNREIHVTSTMGGRHISPAHPQGRAIDFVVDHLTIPESIEVEKMATKCGFHAFNEYIHDSPYKTGPHMHVEL